jgi:hypothetical protein
MYDLAYLEINSCDPLNLSNKVKLAAHNGYGGYSTAEILNRSTHRTSHDIN